MGEDSQASSPPDGLDDGYRVFLNDSLALSVVGRLKLEFRKQSFHVRTRTRGIENRKNMNTVF